VCSANELQNARAACSGGPDTTGCQAFYQFELQTNSACELCLEPFDASFQDAVGLFSCLAPFVSASCDHSTGCASDCIDTSCSQCLTQADSDQCRNDVRNGQCGTYFQQSQCVAQALFGPGAFCNPQNYQGNFGQWLQGVGGHYCGP
jgi:hypothetical protein